VSRAVDTRRPWIYSNVPAETCRVFDPGERMPERRSTPTLSVLNTEASTFWCHK
jgi:hypothetical protein